MRSDMQKGKNMMSFKKYSSIENSFNREFMERVITEMPTDLQYVIQEKVYGANASFLCDGLQVQFAKRTFVFSEDEKFYDYPGLLEIYKERVLRLFTYLKNKYPEVMAISVFGEMFGGRYPHQDVKPICKYTLIQKGVCYILVHESYGFNIYLSVEGGGRYLPVAEINELFEQFGFFYAKTLFQDTLAECLKFPNAFQSHISDWYLKDISKEQAIELLEKKEKPESFKHMTLRAYIHYWRKVYEALGYKCEGQSDIDVFRYSSKGYKVEGYNLDSEEVFTKWMDDVSPYHGFDVVYACVHFFSNYEKDRWNFLLSTHIYWNLNEYIRVAVLVYNEGILLGFDNREKILSILRGTDYVRICPNAYRYFQSGDVGNEINLPDLNEYISVETVKLIITNTEWEKLTEVKLNKD